MLTYLKNQLIRWMGWTKVKVDAYRVTASPVRITPPYAVGMHGAPVTIGYRLKIDKIDARQSHIPAVEFTAMIRSTTLDRQQLEAALIDFFRSFGVDAVSAHGTSTTEDTHEIFITVATFALRN